jgi:uncharacterized protein YecE (DUF72 family)
MEDSTAGAGWARGKYNRAVGEIRIGTSGWSYPSGPGTWNGIFYPSRARGGRSAKVDELAFYAEHFDTVEVNASFYRLPDPELVRSWAARTPAGFDFSLKLFQKFTHPGMYKKAHAPGMPADDEIAAIPAVTRADADAFKAAIDPLAGAGKLGALLAQFPPSFRAGDDARDYLGWLLQAFRGYPVAVELRHKSWSDDMGGTLALLNSFGAAWAQIDEPKFRFSIRQNLLPNLRTLYYMRLHGRNADTWWTHDHPDERYNYLYTPDEIDGFAETVDTVRRLVHKIYVYMNNHFAGKAVANAATLRHRLGQPVPGDYSDAMIARYPFLASCVSLTHRGSLFGDEGAGEHESGRDSEGDHAEDAEPQEG